MSDLDGLGIWTWWDGMPGPEAADFVRRVEALGYTTAWVPEATGAHPFALIAHCAAATSTLKFATGIANIYGRDPVTMRAAQLTLGQLTGGRFLLGLGVSHVPLVEGVRGHTYGRPIAAMREYLERMRAAPFTGVTPDEEPPILLAALRERMLGLARDETAGAHPYFTTPEHTERARAILGTDRLLAPEQKVLLETDPERARTAARGHMAGYLRLPNYRNSLLALGFAEEELDDGGSDRLVDAIVAWGDVETIKTRIQEHFDAGADHVCIQPLRPDGQRGPHLEAVEALAPR